MPQLDLFVYITQVYSILIFFCCFFLAFTKFWEKILFQVEIITFKLFLWRRYVRSFLLQSLILKSIVKQPSSYLTCTVFSPFYC
jgi:hypothetical protein